MITTFYFLIMKDKEPKYSTWEFIFYYSRLAGGKSAMNQRFNTKFRQENQIPLQISCRFFSFVVMINITEKEIDR